MTTAVDLNSDVGEGYGAWKGGPDRELMAIITSANIACGFHAGDPSIIRRTCEMAVANNVSIAPTSAIPIWPASAVGSSTCVPTISRMR